MLFWLEFLRVVFWAALVFLYGTLLSLFRWGDLNLNRDVGRRLSRRILPGLGIRLEIEGLENVPPGAKIFVANHQTGFEMILFGAFCPERTLFIGKKELVWIPVFGLYFLAAGNIIIDRAHRSKAVATLARTAQKIREKSASIIVFPEGTRNRGTEPLLPFKRGPFYLALEAQVPLVPIVLGPIREVFDWKKRILRPGTIRIRILPPIETAGRNKEDATELAAEVRQAMLAAM